MARADRGLDGLLLVDKPSGWTSHDIVAKVRRISGQRRIGHTGTLDPMATGLLVLCLGRATRLVEYLTAHDKRYEGVISLGTATDTDDADGATIATAPVPDLAPGVVRSLEARFTGELEQIPPAYSAIKVGGRRAYAAARAGAPIALTPRPIVVHALSLSPLGPETLALSVHCGPGAYIRSLARDIGAALGCGGHLSALRRTTVGAFTVDSAWTLPELEDAAGRGAFEDLLLAPDEGLLAWPAAILGDAHAASLVHGGRPAVEASTIAPIAVRAYDTGGSFIAIARLVPGGSIEPLKVLISDAGTSYVVYRYDLR